MMPRPVCFLNSCSASPSIIAAPTISAATRLQKIASRDMVQATAIRARMKTFLRNEDTMESCARRMDSSTDAATSMSPTSGIRMA